MDNSPPADSRKIASRLLAANPPKEDGIVPGSVRSVVKRVDGTNGAILRNNQEYYSIAIQELAGDRATLGGQAEIVIRCRAQKTGGGDIIAADNISLREEAPTLIWKRLQLKVNGVPINSCQRSDIVRHFIDRTFSSSCRNSKDADRGPYDYRQYGADANIRDFVVSTVFKKTIIQDGKTFELIRPLDDLPLLGAWGGVIPGFMSMTLDATLGDPASVFVANSGEFLNPPQLVLESIEVRTRMVRLEPSIAKALEDMWASGELTMNAETWTTTQIPPQISAGSTEFTSDTALALNSAPDILAIVMFPKDSFTPSDPSWEADHPLLQTWNNLKEFTIKQQGECIKTWNYLDKSKTSAHTSVVEALETASGTHSGTGAPWQKDTLDSLSFVSGFTGSLVLAFRNWMERSPHDITPMNLDFHAIFDSTPENVSLYAIHKILHQWNFSSVQGATRIV